MKSEQQMAEPSWPQDLDKVTIADMARVLWKKPDGFGPDDLPAEARAMTLSPKNGNDALGERVRRRIQHLLDAPSEFLPDYSERYELLMTACDSLSPRGAIAATTLLGQDNSIGFEAIPSPRDADIRFPRDHEIKYDFVLGWYFVVGNFRGKKPDGTELEFGIEYCLFNYSILPPDRAKEEGLSPLENAIVEGQLVVSISGDPGDHFEAKPTVVSGTSGLLEFSNQPFVANVGNQKMESESAADLFPMRLQITDVESETSIDFRLASSKAILLQGKNGTAPSISGLGSLYYSIPGIALDASASNFVVKGEEIELIDSNKFWFDHQWTTGLIPPGAPRSKVLRALGAAQAATSKSDQPGVGWDWFEFQFDNDHQFTGACAHGDKSLVGNDSPTKPGPATAALSIAKVMMPDSSVIDVEGTMTITDWHKSPSSGVWNPNGYKFELTGAPDSIAHFICTPINTTGQHVTAAIGAEYREGPVRVINSSNGDDIGRGYCEGVGYAATPAWALEALKVAATEPNVRKVQEVKIDKATAIKSTGLVGAIAIVAFGTLAILVRGLLRRIKPSREAD